jgi:hypothetical protein
MAMTRIRMVLVPGLMLTLMLALMLTVAACGGDEGHGVASLGDGDQTTTSPGGGDPQQAALAYARCMRQQGIDIPDPMPDGGIDERGIGVDPDGPKFKAAEQACQQYKLNRDTQSQSNGGGK